MGEWGKPFPWVLIGVWTAVILAGVGAAAGSWVLACKLIDMFTGA